MRKHFLSVLIIFLLLFIYGSFLAHKVNLVTADLGRHIRNGEYFFQNWQPIKTNFYSYTEPDFPVQNHHWLGGVVFYLVWKLGGFTGLSIFFLILSLATFLIFFYLAIKNSNLSLTVLISLLLIPLLAERTEVRPEIFSYFFSAIFFLCLSKKRWLWFLPIIEVFWVNLHIYFFLGPTIIGVFLLTNLLQRSKNWRRLAIAFITTIIATLVNFHGLQGVLSPLTIFDNYGYRLIENQTVWFIEKLITNPNFLIFKIVFALLLVSFIFVLQQKKKISLPYLFLGTIFSTMAWLAIRNFTIFALFSLPIISANLNLVLDKKLKKLQSLLTFLTLGLVIFILPLVASNRLQKLIGRGYKFGFGLETKNSQAIEFFKSNQIKGPILNNYDIGGYLIFHLFPQEKVFVDNRPEAYSEKFFKEVYIPLQENEEVWQKQLENYQFNTIFFSRRDATPWGQNFLIQRVQDQNWAPVFVDNRIIVFLKRNEENKTIIQDHEIPQEHFRITQKN